MAYEITIFLGDSPYSEGAQISSKQHGDDDWNEMGMMLKANLIAMLPGLIEQAAEQAGVEIVELDECAVPVGQLLN